MSSTRLPGKVLRPLAGRPMLAWLIDGLQHAELLDSIVVATSTEPDDDAIEEWCIQADIAVHRGSLTHVATRVLDAALAHGLDVVVRVSGDSPLLLPAVVDQVISLLADPDTDIATNVHPRSFPPGQSVEAIRTTVLAKAAPKLSRVHQEHVTSWFYANASDYRITNLGREQPLNDVRLVVDTHDDLLAIEGLLTYLNRPYWTYALEELVDLRRSVVDDAP